MGAIIFKAYLINKLTYWLFAISVVVGVVIYREFNLTDEYRTIACGVSILTGFLIVFYLNRFEPKLIKLDNDIFEITYSNQRYFKREKANYSKNSVNVLDENDKLILSNEAGIIAKIRRKALEPEDWETLRNYFA
jgi:hypothetical protein